MLKCSGLVLKMIAAPTVPNYDGVCALFQVIRRVQTAVKRCECPKCLFRREVFADLRRLRRIQYREAIVKKLKWLITR